MAMALFCLFVPIVGSFDQKEERSQMRPPRSNLLLLSLSLADPLHSQRRATRLRTISPLPPARHTLHHRLEVVANVAVRVELSSGPVGWGEAPVLPSVTAEEQPVALAAIARACAALVAARIVPLGAVL
ncbi:hypothetical protein ACQJBY_008100 [Aegilops geniculata]